MTIDNNKIRIKLNSSKILRKRNLIVSSEPSLRVYMMGYTYLGRTLGMLVISVLNTLMPWRIIAFICMFVPIITTFGLFFIPETPLWLLGHGKTVEAEKALCWLRGWVPKEAVAEEFQALQRYSARFNSCGLCIKLNQVCSHSSTTIGERLAEIKRKKTLKPMFIVMSLVVIFQFARIVVMPAYVLQIFRAYGSPVAPDKAVAILNFSDTVAYITLMLLIRVISRRRLYLTMLSLLFVCYVVICCYGWMILPSGYNSFDASIHFEPNNKNLGYLPMVCLIASSFFFNCGVMTMSSHLVSEVISLKTRGTAVALIVTLSYAVSFTITKSYHILECVLSLPGMVLVSCSVVGGGLILMYYILPCTANHSLEDIEHHFSDNSKKITDRKIHTISSQTYA